jgi:hypothetical protein
LQRKRSEDCKQVFDRFEKPKAAMRQNAVKAERNSQRYGGIRYDGGRGQRRPAEETGPEGRERSNVNSYESKTFDPAIRLIHISLVERSYYKTNSFKWK